MQTRRLALSIITALTLLSASCSKDQASPAKPDPDTAQSPSTSQGAHAAANVKPGSYEDWCGEHQVPESQCTRCNPDLIPAFKATNDWCAEHNLPESQCLKCNPGITIKRPPKER